MLAAAGDIDLNRSANPHLEAAPELDNVAVRKAAVQPYLADELPLVELAQLLHVVDLDGARLARLAVDGLLGVEFVVVVCCCEGLRLELE